MDVTVHQPWHKAVEEHLKIMEEAHNKALQFNPVTKKEEFSAAYEVFDGTCLAFIDHINNTFGTTENFVNFLKETLKTHVESRGYSSDQVDEMYWGMETKTPSDVGLGLSRIYHSFITRADEVNYMAGHYKPEDLLFARSPTIPGP